MPYNLRYLTKANGQTQSIQGTSLDCLALVAKGADILELQGTVTIRKIVLGRPPPPGYYINSRLKRNPNLPLKKAYLLSLEPHQEGQVLGFPHIYRLKMHPQGT